MKTKLILLTLLIALSAIFTSHADIPKVINFQGKATDAGGNPLSGDYKLTFRIYDAVTAGNLKWTEVHDPVAITNGVFQVLLGSVTALDLPFNESYWITVEVNNDGEMLNNGLRTPLASVGYAYTAEYAVTAGSLTEPQASIPSGVIVMWSGNIANIPEGWALCDGTNGTPDLRDKFIVGARQDDAGVAKTTLKGSLMQAGGVHEVTLTVSQIPAHTHSIETRGNSANVPGTVSEGDGGSHSNASTYSTGGGQAHENSPPFYALCFIMKE